MAKKELHPDLAALSPENLLTVTLFGEVRGEPLDGIVGVAHVIRNRALKGASLANVIGRWAQFSCLWAELGGENFKAVLEAARGLQKGEETPLLRKLAYLGRGVLGEFLPDPTYGATHYHTTTLSPLPLWTRPPAWVTTRLGRHVFYKGVA